MILCRVAYCKLMSNVGGPGVTSIAVGPKSTMESRTVVFVDVLVMKTYVCPIAVSGIVAEIMPLSMVPGTDVTSKPLTKVTKKLAGKDPLTLNVKGMPTEAGIPWVAVSVGNALTGRVGLELGHDLMKAAAIVYTSFRPRAVPYGLAGAISPRLNR